ncbi:MAG: hypothetical protein GY795_34080 [Desulfobacterales bacterium]|nr:hypothetical protein [Desulfobacterales bacterium]
MQIWLEERIGDPGLFTGRKKDLAYLLDWIRGTKRKISQSTAIFSRRKTGKTALVQRLFNIAFNQNDGVIPFYFEIKETDKWIGDFARDFFLTFICQYLAFKTRNKNYLSFRNFEKPLDICCKQKLDYLADIIKEMQTAYQEEDIYILWETARELPRHLAEYTGERIVQIIDEFQFINRFIFRDKACTRRLGNLAASYLHTCEYKSAPLLVTGSWVGWLMNDLNRYLPGRFLKSPLENMPEDEAIETICKHALISGIQITENTTHLIARLTEGNPFYISALIRSKYPGKDLTTKQGVLKTLEFETLNLDANINATWMEYLDSAFSRINDVHAKDMVLYLSKNRHRYVSRKELKTRLKLDMADTELEKKFRALYRADIIEEEYGRYRGVRDNIFDKVFRRSYTDDIDKFLTEEAPDEYRELFEKISGEYKKLMGKYSRYKGAFAEFAISRHLSDAHKNGILYKSMFENLPDDFEFTEYDNVWSYHSPPLHELEFQIDIFARAEKGEYSLLGEIKNRKAKFSVKEAEDFVKKADEAIKLEKIATGVLFVFSVNGFFKNTLEYFEKHGIAWTKNKRLLEKQ